MASFYNEITPTLDEFIQQQKIFFVGTAANEGRVNVSPKGMDSLRVTAPDKVVWLNLTGSGNETAAHLLKNNRMTIMMCAFEGNPLILRIYGSATIYHERDEQFHEYLKLFPETAGARQIFELQVESVQTSCGYAVPLMEYQEDRTILKKWAENKGEEKIRNYWKDKNTVTIDNFDTNIFGEE